MPGAGSAMKLLRSTERLLTGNPSLTGPRQTGETHEQSVARLGDVYIFTSLWVVL
jgi:hypothetical protein